MSRDTICGVLMNNILCDRISSVGRASDQRPRGLGFKSHGSQKICGGGGISINPNITLLFSFARWYKYATTKGGRR